MNKRDMDCGIEKYESGIEKYESIIERPHHRSLTRAPMPAQARAAQFAPFAALSGYEEEIRKAAEEHMRKAEGK